MKRYLILVCIVIAASAVYIYSVYNKIYAAGMAVDSQWTSLEADYQKKFDLIPQVTATIQGFVDQRQKAFADIAEARTIYSEASTVDSKVAAADQVEAALRGLLIVASSSPDLSSSQVFTDMKVGLDVADNSINSHKNSFNQAIDTYNKSVNEFPGSFIAPYFGFYQRNYFN